MLSKWKLNISEVCEYCNILETTQHMLYECERIRNIWEEVSICLKCNISWKTIVCGFPNYDTSEKLYTVNLIVSIISRTIFRMNLYCKFENQNYRVINLKSAIIKTLVCNKSILTQKNNVLATFYVENIMKRLKR